MQPCDAVGTVEGGSEGAVKRVLIATVFIACRRHTSHRPRQQKPSCSHQYSIRLLSDQVYGHSTARAPACVCVCYTYMTIITLKTKLLEHTMLKQTRRPDIIGLTPGDVVWPRPVPVGTLHREQTCHWGREVTR